MLSFNNFSIRTKVLAAFAAVLVAAGGLGGFAIDRLATVEGSAAEIRDNWLPATGWLGIMARTLAEYRIQQATHLMAVTAADKSREGDGLKASLEKFAKTSRLYLPTVTTAEEKALVAGFQTAWKIYLEDSKRFLELSRKNQTEAATSLYVGKLRG